MFNMVLRITDGFTIIGENEKFASCSTQKK